MATNVQDMHRAGEDASLRPSRLDVDIEAPLLSYYPILRLVAELITLRRQGRSEDQFVPAFALPVLDRELARFLQQPSIGLADLTSHRGRRVVLLDLMRDPGTPTTKTPPSTPMVLRALNHLRSTAGPALTRTPT